MNWLKEKGLRKKEYFLAVGRFVPENNYETMIREFKESRTDKHTAIVTTVNEKFLEHLEAKLHFKQDRRIKFVGTVYDQELLKKIRESAYAYLHGHEVGGTNPSLLEALGSTDLNLLLDVGFNREVARDVALYWTKEEGNLAGCINEADEMDTKVIEDFGREAKQRIADGYTWKIIADKYKGMFMDRVR